MNYWVQPLVVSGGIFTVDGDPVVGDTAIVPVGATVEITFDQQSFADSGLSFGSWEIDGLSNSEYYKNKESFTFTMPKNRVAVTASTMDIPSAPTIDDAPVDPAISTAVTIIGGALLVGGLHQLGTELWLIHHLASNWPKCSGRMPDSLLLLPKPLIPISTPTTPMRSRLHSGQLKTS